MNENSGGGLVLVLIVFAVYFLPSLVALARHHHQVGTVFVLNLFLGWTLVGWVVAFAIAASAVKRAAPGAAPALRPCPHCAEMIQPAAKVCRFCGRGVAPAATPA